MKIVEGALVLIVAGLAGCVAGPSSGDPAEERFMLETEGQTRPDGGVYGEGVSCFAVAARNSGIALVSVDMGTGELVETDWFGEGMVDSGFHADALAVTRQHIVMQSYTGSGEAWVIIDRATREVEVTSGRMTNGVAVYDGTFVSLRPGQLELCTYDGLDALLEDREGECYALTRPAYQVAISGERALVSDMALAEVDAYDMETSRAVDTLRLESSEPVVWGMSAASDVLFTISPGEGRTPVIEGYRQTDATRVFEAHGASDPSLAYTHPLSGLWCESVE